MVSGGLRSGCFGVQDVEKPVGIANAVPVERYDRPRQRAGTGLVEIQPAGGRQSREHALEDIEILRLEHAEMLGVQKHVHTAPPFEPHPAGNIAFGCGRNFKGIIRQQQVGKSRRCRGWQETTKRGLRLRYSPL